MRLPRRHEQRKANDARFATGDAERRDLDRAKLSSELDTSRTDEEYT